MVVLGSVLFVDQMHDSEDSRRGAQLVSSELVQDAAEIRVAEAVMMRGQSLDEAIVEVDAEVAELAASTTELTELGDDAVAAEVERDFRTVEAALSSQLALLRSGDLAAAEELAVLQTRPAFDAFEERVAAADDSYESSAERASTVSDIGVWVSMLLAGFAIDGLSWRHERSRRAALCAVALHGERERKLMEQRLRERAAEVEELTERHRQLEALKYTFVTSVSHELRTPLTAIYGSLELLEDGDVGPLSPAASEVVALAARGTRRLVRLVEGIIDLTRLESGAFGSDPVSLDLHDLIIDAVQSLAPLTKGTGVELVLHDTHAAVKCDADRVVQALVNLVGNAIKFTPNDGAVHIDVGRLGDEVEVTVRDTGRGIPTDQLDAVFERFHQVDTRADRAKGGAGLGLTITRHIIEAGDGRIWVESEVDSGTTFHFTLPPTLLEQPHGQNEPAALRTEPANA